MAADLNVRILGDIQQLSRKLGEAEGKFSGFASNVKKVAGGLAAAFAFRELGQFAVGLGQTATQMESWGRKADAVFGESLTSVEQWADGAARAMGLTTAEAVNAASGVADLLKPMGFTAAQAADMSTELVGLSGALAEWSGGQYDAAEVSDILAKAMLGERDSLKSLGISISQAEVDQRALTIAQKDGRNAVTQLDQALATQQLVMEKSTDAQAAFAEGGGTLARRQAELGAQFREFQQNLAERLLPILLNLADIFEQHVAPAIGVAAAFLTKNLGPAFDDLRALVARWAPKVAGFLQDVADKAGEVADWFLVVAWPRIDEALQYVIDKAGELVDWFNTHVAPTIEVVLARIQAAVEQFAAVVGAIWSRWGEEIAAVTSHVFGQIRTVVKTAVGTIRGVIETLLALIRGDWGQAWESASGVVETVWSGITTFIGDAIDGLLGVLRSLPGEVAQLGVDIARAFIDALVDAIKGAAGEIASAVRGALPSPSGVVSSITGGIGGLIPGFHTGGTFHAPVGKSEGLAILRDGEKILTPGQHRIDDERRRGNDRPQAAHTFVFNKTDPSPDVLVHGMVLAERLSA